MQPIRALRSTLALVPVLLLTVAQAAPAPAGAEAALSRTGHDPKCFEEVREGRPAELTVMWRPVGCPGEPYLGWTGWTALAVQWVLSQPLTRYQINAIAVALQAAQVREYLGPYGSSPLSIRAMEAVTPNGQAVVMIEFLPDEVARRAKTGSTTNGEKLIIVEAFPVLVVLDRESMKVLSVRPGKW